MRSLEKKKGWAYILGNPTLLFCLSARHFMFLVYAIESCVISCSRAIQLSSNVGHLACSSASTLFHS